MNRKSLYALIKEIAMLSKKEKEKIRIQMRKPAERGETWVGYRSVVMKDRTKDTKTTRRNNKKMCRDYED